MKLDYLRMNMEIDKHEEHKLVGFLIENVCYGIDIMDVREVINPADLVNIPTLPPYVLGVVDHRKDLIPIIDLRSRFGLDEAVRSKRTKWIILRLQGREVGLQVDRVTQVVSVDSSMKRNKLQMTSKDKPWIEDVYRTDDNIVFELNLNTVIDTAQLELDPTLVRKTEQ
jgi:purine-binding chemotaxis protein CheW